MRQIWAIAKITLAESVRTRVAVAFIVLLVGLMALLVGTAKGNGTASGRVQMFLSYSLGTAYFLVTLLAVFIVCQSLDADIKTQRIDSLVSKPVARWQILAGKYLGVALLSALLVGISAVFTFALTLHYRSPKDLSEAERFKLNNSVLVARRSVSLPLPDVSQQVRQRYEQARRMGELDPGTTRSEFEKVYTEQLIRQSRTVKFRNSKTWKITGLSPPQEGDVVITLRFKYEPSRNPRAVPELGLYRDTILGRWIIGDPTSPKVYVWEDQKPTRTAHEILIPVNAIEPDGTLTLTFQNLDPRDISVHLPLKDGVEVLYRVGTFWPNFIRTVLALFVMVLFVTAVALAASTFLSFPVAALVTLTMFFLGLSSGFLTEALGLDGGHIAGKSALISLDRAVGWLVLHILPRLDASHLTTLLIDGREVSWAMLSWRALGLVVIRGGLLAVAAMVIFNRRELGKLTV